MEEQRETQVVIVCYHVLDYSVLHHSVLFHLVCLVALHAAIALLTAAADLVWHLEQCGDSVLDGRNVCVQRAGTARDARGERGRYALLLHGLCSAVYDGERIRAADAEHP